MLRKLLFFKTYFFGWDPLIISNVKEKVETGNNESYQGQNISGRWRCLFVLKIVITYHKFSSILWSLILRNFWPGGAVGFQTQGRCLRSWTMWTRRIIRTRWVRSSQKRVFRRWNPWIGWPQSLMIRSKYLIRVNANILQILI